MVTRNTLGEDLLSEETRRARRNLDLVAVVALLVLALDLVPRRINALGIDLEGEQQGVLWVLLIFDMAFAVLFAVYAASDVARSRALLTMVDTELAELARQEPRWEHIEERLTEAVQASLEQRRGLTVDIEAQAAALASALTRHRELEILRQLGWLRFLAEFAVPLVLGAAAAIWLLIRIA